MGNGWTRDWPRIQGSPRPAPKSSDTSENVFLPLRPCILSILSPIICFPQPFPQCIEAGHAYPWPLYPKVQVPPILAFVSGCVYGFFLNLSLLPLRIPLAVRFEAFYRWSNVCRSTCKVICKYATFYRRNLWSLLSAKGKEAQVYLKWCMLTGLQQPLSENHDVSYNFSHYYLLLPFKRYQMYTSLPEHISGFIFSLMEKPYIPWVGEFRKKWLKITGQLKHWLFMYQFETAWLITILKSGDSETFPCCPAWFTLSYKVQITGKYLEAKGAGSTDPLPRVQFGVGTLNFLLSNWVM